MTDHMNGPPGSERPAPARKPAPRNHTDTAQFSVPWRQDWNEPLTAEDRADIDVLIAAAERGFRLATRCLRCGQWLVTAKSIRAHMGPVCRAKVGAE